MTDANAAFDSLRLFGSDERYNGHASADIVNQGEYTRNQKIATSAIWSQSGAKRTQLGHRRSEANDPLRKSTNGACGCQIG